MRNNKFVHSVSEYESQRTRLCELLRAKSGYYFRHILPSASITVTPTWRILVKF